MNIDLKQGNCLDLMKQIPNESVDMILCDLHQLLNGLDKNLK